MSVRCSERTRCNVSYCRNIRTYSSYKLLRLFAASPLYALKLADMPPAQLCDVPFVLAVTWSCGLYAVARDL